jgi:hypothetical protein
LPYVGSSKVPLKPELEAQETWVNVTEAAELTGYSRDRILKVTTKTWKLPEEQRPIRLRKRSSGYDIWLPDLLTYIEEFGRGPQRKRKTAS